MLLLSIALTSWISKNLLVGIVSTKKKKIKVRRWSSFFCAKYRFVGSVDLLLRVEGSTRGSSLTTLCGTHSLEQLSLQD